MRRGSANDNHANGTRASVSERDPIARGFRFSDEMLVDSLIDEASKVAKDAYSLERIGKSPEGNSRMGILETLLKNRDAFLTTTRLSHAVAWLLAAKEVISGRKPPQYLGNFDLAAVRTIGDDPYLRKAPCGESVGWAPLLKRSNEIFQQVIELNDQVNSTLIRQ